MQQLKHNDECKCGAKLPKGATVGWDEKLGVVFNCAACRPSRLTTVAWSRRPTLTALRGLFRRTAGAAGRPRTPTHGKACPLPRKEPPMSEAVERWKAALHEAEGTIHDILANIEDEGDRAYLGSTNDTDTLKTLAMKLQALRFSEAAALTKPPEGEPVAWRVRVADGWPWHLSDDPDRQRDAGWEVQPLYTRPVAWPEGYKLVPVEPTEAMLAAARVAPTNSFRSHGPHYSDYASIYAAMLSASDGAGTEGGVG